MEIVTPNRKHFLVPDGTQEVTFAKDQPIYRALPALVTPAGAVVSQWMPTPGELALLNAGVAVTVVVFHGSFSRVCTVCGDENQQNLLRPISVMVGGANVT